MKALAPALPSIRMTDIEILPDWHLEDVKALGDRVPGYKSSATFLTSLRSNLALSACEPSPYNSLASTPITTSFNIPGPRPPQGPSKLSISTSASDIYQSNSHPPNEPVAPQQFPSSPKLTNNVAKPDQLADRTAALALIAESVKEQRWATARAVVLHPTSIAITVVASSLLIMTSSSSPALAALVLAALLITGLVCLYWVTMDYGYLALAVDWDWFDYAKKTGPHSGKGEDPIVVVSRWGEQIIAAVVMRVVKRERKGYVKAWTVEKGFRGNGVGAGLMEEAVRVAWGKGARTMMFEADHASE